MNRLDLEEFLSEVLADVDNVPESLRDGIKATASGSGDPVETLKALFREQASG